MCLIDYSAVPLTDPGSGASTSTSTELTEDPLASTAADVARLLSRLLAYSSGRRASRLPAEQEAQPWKLAALNYNTSRTPGAAYDESTDGKLGSVYTALTEKLIARGDWKR